MCIFFQAADTWGIRNSGRADCYIIVNKNRGVRLIIAIRAGTRCDFKLFIKIIAVKEAERNERLQMYTNTRAPSHTELYIKII